MSFTTGPDGTAERAAIVARLKANLVGGRVYDDLPDATELPRDASGELLPYIFVGFTSPSPDNTGRTVAGTAGEQPHVMGISVECWAPRQGSAGAVAGAVRRVLVGWRPNEQSGEVELTGGGQFTARSTRSLPSRTMEQVRGQVGFNLGVPTF